MRCFIAVDLSEEARKELEKAQKEIPEGKFNFVNPKQIHLTVKFLGDIDEKKVDEIKGVMSSIKFSKFKAKIGSIGFFSRDFIRVIWASVEPKDKLVEIHDVIDKELEKIGIEKDLRPFESHATLARVKRIENKSEFIEKLGNIKIKPLEFIVDKILLKKSTLTKQGPIYENLFELNLL